MQAVSSWSPFPPRHGAVRVELSSEIFVTLREPIDPAIPRFDAVVQVLVAPISEKYTTIY